LNKIDIYETNLSIESTIVQYLFESKGEKKLIKAVQYSGFKTQTGLIMYNLGFGDYDFETKSISNKKTRPSLPKKKQSRFSINLKKIRNYKSPMRSHRNISPFFPGC